ncbi:hypothetical protein B9K09_15560 [Pseudomonas sp. M30-35]|nr:hypothetical protein B9K09_15560 [Pseudomonas sp. M30-35]
MLDLQAACDCCVDIRIGCDWPGLVWCWSISGKAATLGPLLACAMVKLQAYKQQYNCPIGSDE